MKSDMRLQVLVAGVALLMSMLTAYALSDGPSADARDAGELCRDLRHGGAVSGIICRGRQGADPSALPELPSGR